MIAAMWIGIILGVVSTLLILVSQVRVSESSYKREIAPTQSAGKLGKLGLALSLFIIFASVYGLWLGM